MEKRVFGIILTVLGVAGLIAAGSFFMRSGSTYDVKSIVLYGLLGLIFFMSGIGLLRNTRDKAT